MAASEYLIMPILNYVVQRECSISPRALPNMLNLYPDTEGFCIENAEMHARMRAQHSRTWTHKHHSVRLVHAHVCDTHKHQACNVLRMSDMSATRSVSMGTSSLEHAVRLAHALRYHA